MDKNAGKITRLLDTYYKDEISFLEYSSPFQLLIAVILSAQTTDRQVNAVTPRLFNEFPDAEKLGNAHAEKVQEIIRSLGFYKVKANHIIASAKMLADDYQSRVPPDFNDLLRFPGIGRKSANVIRGHIFALPAIIVDTHFGRVCRRLGLTESKDPDRVERDLRKLVPDNQQMDFSMKINKLGRDFCHARKPDCGKCPLVDCCPQLIGPK